MPKKKSVKKAASAMDPNGDRVPRKEPYTAERLKVIVERIKDQVGRLSGLARAIDDSKIEAVVVDGHAMLLRGMNQIDNFADNLSRAVRESKAKKTSM